MAQKSQNNLNPLQAAGIGIAGAAAGMAAASLMDKENRKKLGQAVEKAGQWAREQQDNLNETTQEVRQTIEEKGDQIREKLEVAGDKAQEHADRTGKEAKKMADSARKATSKAGKDTRQAARN